jgi:hypothetical protein
MKGLRIAVCLAPSAVAAQGGRVVRVIERPTATSAAFASVSGIRALPDGRVLVNDARSRRVILLDTTLSIVRVVLDSVAKDGDAGTFYGFQRAGISSYSGDSTLVYDAETLSAIIIDPQGTIARVAALPRANDAIYMLGSPIAFDWAGRLVYRSAPSRRPRSSNPTRSAGVTRLPDSAFIAAYDPTTRKIDTLALLTLAPAFQVVEETKNGLRTFSQIDPLPVSDDWARLSDGSIVVLNGREYRMDRISALGTKRGKRIPFPWERLDDDAKIAIRDSTLKTLGGPVAGTLDSVATAWQRNAVIQASDLPDYRPAFVTGGLRSDAESRLWIRTTISHGLALGSVYDVVDAEGNLVDCIQLQPGRVILGFGKNGVVFTGFPDTGGVRIERIVHERVR